MVNVQNSGNFIPQVRVLLDFLLCYGQQEQSCQWRSSILFLFFCSFFFVYVGDVPFGDLSSQFECWNTTRPWIRIPSLACVGTISYRLQVHISYLGINSSYRWIYSFYSSIPQGLIIMCHTCIVSSYFC